MHLVYVILVSRNEANFFGFTPIYLRIQSYFINNQTFEIAPKFFNKLAKLVSKNCL